MGGSNLPINETGDYDDQVPLKHPNERKPEYPSSPWIRIVGNPQGFPEGERHPTPRGRGGAPAQPAAGIQQVAFFPQLREPPTDLSLVRKFYQWLMGPPPSSPGGGWSLRMPLAMPWKAETAKMQKISVTKTY